MHSTNTRENLLELLKLIDSRLKSKVIIVCLGGTALTLMGLKLKSNDIDIIVVSAENPDEFYDVYFEAIDELKLSADDPPFTDFDMSLLKIKDYLQKSRLFTDIPLKNITFYTMNILDIILSKNCRNLLKDRDDIINIVKAISISKQKLYLRFIELLKQQDPDQRKSFTESYDRLIKNFGDLLK